MQHCANILSIYYQLKHDTKQILSPFYKVNVGGGAVWRGGGDNMLRNSDKLESEFLYSTLQYIKKI